MIYEGADRERGRWEMRGREGEGKGRQKGEEGEGGARREKRGGRRERGEKWPKREGGKNRKLLRAHSVRRSE